MLLTKEQQDSYENAKICYICQEIFEISIWKTKKNVVKLGVVVIIKENIEVLRIVNTI